MGSTEFYIGIYFFLDALFIQNSTLSHVYSPVNKSMHNFTSQIELNRTPILFDF